MNQKHKPLDPTRREVVKGAVLSAALAPMALRQGSMGPLRFFVPDEFLLLDNLTEIIIPTDEHSPGASSARVAEYIDMVISESPAEKQQLWREGLKAVESLSREVAGDRFLKVSMNKRIEILTRIAGDEDKPTKLSEKFFIELKGLTVKGYYTSKIGIHTEMQYKGNVYLKEYVGEDLPS